MARLSQLLDTINTSEEVVETVHDWHVQGPYLDIICVVYQLAEKVLARPLPTRTLYPVDVARIEYKRLTDLAHLMGVQINPALPAP